jgi:hypothetical protein
MRLTIMLLLYSFLQIANRSHFVPLSPVPDDDCQANAVKHLPFDAPIAQRVKRSEVKYNCLNSMFSQQPHGHVAFAKPTNAADRVLIC